MQNPGMLCPKCAYLRSERDANPAWQCPGCGIAYAKYRPRAAGLIAEGREMAAEARGDRSVLVLVLANLFALGIAWATGMGLAQMMAVYWVQSVIIGLTNVIRILNLQRFSTEGFSSNGKRVPEDESGKRGTAFFFAFHYGFFHLGYLVFLLTGSKGGGGLGSAAGLALCALVFALNHGYSMQHNIRRDARGKPNLGTLMFLPYARIVPMHLLIILGASVAATPFHFMLFVALKILADVVMHTVEHHVLAKVPPPTP
jgi:hypothetical protein